ncbi:MAG: hypothetical protein HYW25_03885 [Candidatus Aenigmarchaeota archaeon]|nr:hypothetical protein [Candidatus Aenigmarchaeota archaeon]
MDNGIREDIVYILSGNDIIQTVVLGERMPSNSLAELSEALEKGELDKTSRAKLQVFAGKMKANLARAKFGEEYDDSTRRFIDARLHEIFFAYELAGVSAERVRGEMDLLRSHCLQAGNQALRNYLDIAVYTVEVQRERGEIPVHLHSTYARPEARTGVA